MTIPRRLLSPYEVRPWCQLGIGDTRTPTGQARWDVSRWDDPAALWASTEPTWLDVSCESIYASSTAGRVRIIDRFTPGLGELTVRNVDGWADMTGPAVPPASLPMRPGRQVRWGVATATGRYPVFRGYIDQADPLYLPYGLDTVTCTTFDALAEVGRITLDELGAAVGDGETADVRVARILDAAGWPPGPYRRLDGTAGRVQATTLGGSVADLLGLTADSVGGVVFGDVDGRLVFRRRDWQTYPSTDPPDATIGNLEPGDVCPSSWELSWARADVAAVARMRRPDGTGVTVVNADAERMIGPEPFDRTDLITFDDGTLTTLANRALQTRGVDTMPRVTAVTLDAARDPGDGSYVELMATARPETPTRLRCRLRDNDRDVFDGELFVTSVDHTITPTGRWFCRFGLDVAAPFAADAGYWDRARWDRSTWIGVPP